MKNPQNLLSPSSPNSELFSNLLESSTDGLKKYYLLMAAWENGLFEHTVTPKTSNTLSQELGGYHEAMLQLFCEALTEIGLLTKLNDTYINSPLTSTYLLHDSPNYMAHSLQNTKANVNRWLQLQIILKNGPIKQKREDFFNENWLINIAEIAEAGAVARTLNVISAHLETNHWKRLIDIGGGHGLYAIAFTALNPQLEAYVFDLPKMTPITEKYVKEYDAQRVHILPGDIYKDSIGQDYDAIFSSFNPSCMDPALIGKIVDATAPGGDIIMRRFTDASHESALKTLDWNLFGFEGKKVGSKPHSSGTVLNQKEYLKALKNTGLTILGTYSMDNMSEITFARKPSDNGSVT
jgi:precorrin-6B methylase 2